MYKTIWKFTVTREKQRSFEEAYGPKGTWAQLFRRAQGYVGTELLRDYAGAPTYFTIDSWSSLADFERFKSEWKADYEKTDQFCEELTEAEAHVGAFTAV